MKIIQSFAEYDEGSSYLNNSVDRNKIYLSFYSFLLSFLTLKKFYGHVTMFCNQKAYESMIKYIPYDEIKIIENKNKFNCWNLYKVDSIAQTDDDVIHVDSDVFVFDDVFNKFYHENSFDVIVQDILPKEHNFISDFTSSNKEFLIKNSIINPDIYDGRCTSCGTVGIRNEYRSEYIEMVKKMTYGYENNQLINANVISMILEELTFYYLILKKNLKVFDVLPYDEILRHGNNFVANNKKYTHLWFNTKYELKYVNLVKEKIKKMFPEHYSLVEYYEAIKR